MSVVARAVVVALVLVLTSGPAYAASNTHHDAVGDVTRYDYDTRHTRVDPANASADIVSTTVRHGEHAVVLSLRLRRFTASYFLIVFQLQVQGQRTRDSIGLVRIKGVRQFSLQNAHGDVLPCPGLRKSLLRGRGLVRFVVPRGCLGNPRWVRAGAAVEVEDYRHNRTYDDLSHRRGTGRVDPDRIPLGPRLFAS